MRVASVRERRWLTDSQRDDRADVLFQKKPRALALSLSLSLSVFSRMHSVSSLRPSSLLWRQTLWCQKGLYFGDLHTCAIVFSIFFNFIWHGSQHFYHLVVSSRTLICILVCLELGMEWIMHTCRLYWALGPFARLCQPSIFKTGMLKTSFSSRPTHPHTRWIFTGCSFRWIRTETKWRGFDSLRTSLLFETVLSRSSLICQHLFLLMYVRIELRKADGLRV